MNTPKYRRILLKISGEILAGGQGYGIHPAVLTERGLAPAVTALADRSPVPVELEALPEQRRPPRRYLL